MNKADYPRCKTCKHLKVTQDDLYWQECKLMASKDSEAVFSASLAYADNQDSQFAWVFVSWDFGCVQHEPLGSAG